MESAIHSKNKLKLTFPKIVTHKQASEYAASKTTMEQTQFRSYEWDKPRQEPSLLQMEARLALKRTEQALADRRDFAKGERIKLDEQWKDLLEKEQDFQKTFKTMNIFVTSNYEKRLRAIQRCRDDKIVVAKRNNEIDELKKKMSGIDESIDEMEKKIFEHRMYEKFLYEVVDRAAGEFKSTNDLISRYEALSSKRNELGARQDATLKELEGARLKTTRLAEEKGFVILGLNNTVADLNARFSVANRNALHWESVVLAIKDQMYRRNQELNQVKQACWNIYNLMSKRKGEVPKITEDDFEKQLLYVKKTLQELNVVRALTVGRSSSSKLETRKKGKTHPWHIKH